MLSEHQPYTLDYCIHCGAQCVACQDWAYPKWVGGDPDCLHEIRYDDEELEEIDQEMSRIDRKIGLIKNYTKIVNAIDAMPLIKAHKACLPK